MDDHRQRFLEAEEQAVSLVAELRALKRETSRSRDASSTLQKVGEDLSSLVDRQVAVTDAIQATIKALRQIGTLEILDAVGSLKSEVARDIRQQLERMAGDTRQLLEGMESSLRSIQVTAYALAGGLILLGVLLLLYVG